MQIHLKFLYMRGYDKCQNWTILKKIYEKTTVMLNKAFFLLKKFSHVSSAESKA